MIKHLFVWVRRADGAIHLVGELATTALGVTADRGTPTLPETLLRMRGGGTGALLFTATDTTPHLDQSASSTALSKLLAAAAQFEAGTLPPGDEFRRLLEGSSRAGGARPKALVHDESGEWLAKFPSRMRDDAYDIVGLEATCLALARRADLAQVLRKHSASPADDLAALYRCMIFNAAIGNVDDHLKNFWMLARPGGFRLAPAFDLVPDISGRGEHTLSFQQGFACPARAEMIALAAEWGVARAAGILDDVAKATRTFATTARGLKVRNPGRLQKVCADVRRRTGLLSALSGGS